MTKLYSQAAPNGMPDMSSGMPDMSNMGQSNPSSEPTIEEVD